jgi:hypothetical protein
VTTTSSWTFYQVVNSSYYLHDYLLVETLEEAREEALEATDISGERTTINHITIRNELASIVTLGNHRIWCWQSRKIEVTQPKRRSSLSKKEKSGS